jgi:NADPH:quinone reductase-like Zn-dependent oxidoreductase
MTETRHEERTAAHPAVAATGNGGTSATSATAPARTMTAVVQEAYGSAEVLHLAVIDRPAIEEGEVLIQVQAAGVDRGTWHLMTGRPYLMRIMGFGVRRPKNRVPGVDVAGTVVEIGADVTKFAVGDEVLGMSRGSFAEFAAAREDKLAHKPANLSFEQAAVVPISGITALQSLLDTGRLEAGTKVLVIGASGGVGTYAVQLAKAVGAEVTGACSTAKLDLVRSLGADHVLDYTDHDFADGTHEYDLILDVGGNSRLRRLRRALAPQGTLVIVGGESKGSVTGGFGRQLRAPIVSLFVRQRLAMHMTKERGADLERLIPYLESGAVTPSIDKTYPLAEVPDALRDLEAGHVRGKAAISLTRPHGSS